MANGVMDIKDEGLRNSVWSLGKALEEKGRKSRRRAAARTSRTFRDHCHDNGTAEQARESAERARKRYGD